jgi:hypothetical protein
MPKAPVTAKIHQALNIHGHLAPKVALNFVLTVDNPANATDLIVGQVVALDAKVDVSLFQDSLGAGTAQTENIGQGYLNPLLTG